MLSLTRQERQVVLFLISVALTGAGIDFFVKRYSPVKTMANFSRDIGKINLNTADRDLLINIPGIGEKLAQRILEYRNKNSSFGDIEELRNIKGITAYRYEKIKDYLVVQ